VSLRRAGTVVCLVVLVGSLLSTSPAAAATTVTVDAVNFSFSPDPVQVSAGDSITWTNKDPEPHTATADDGSFTVLINPGESKTVTLTKDGTFAYYCKFHGAPGGQGMAGTVQVGNQNPPTVRLAATDNVGRALAWSKQNHPDGSAFALLGRADVYADSLASGGAQGKLGAPLLLTASNSLDARTKNELDRLDAKSVYILGGTSAVSSAVETEVKNTGRTVRRLAGSDRIGTANAVADALLPEATSALLVRASGPGTAAFADALGAGAVAAASGQPVLFSDTASLSPGTKAYLQSHPIGQVVLVGGTAALSEQIEKDLEGLDIQSERAAGVDRFQTAAFLSQHVGGDEEGPSTVVLVDGLSPDAWADGFAAAGAEAPVLLVSGDTVPGATGNVVGDAEPSLPLVCGATVTTTACDRLDVIKSSSASDFPKLAAILTAVQGGDPKLGGASGLFFLSGDPSAVCYDYFGTLQDFTAAHVHRKSDGSAAIPLTFGPTSDDDFFGCTFGLNQAVVADVQANPADYYINLHTTAMPSGAISGPVTHITALGLAGLSSEAEVPGPGDTAGAGFGFALTTDTPGQVCAGAFAFGLDGPPISAHIHEAPAGQAGPVVVTLVTPTEDAIPVNCYTVSDSLLSSMKADITKFYINVHTDKFPSGAIRGQFLKPTA
jgi:putative cell wall-binding protein